MTREQEFAHLPALPIVPWAVTLAMTVAYRQFRETSLTVRRFGRKVIGKVLVPLLAL